MAVAVSLPQTAGTAVRAIAGLDASAYVRHALHRPECLWTEKNCYVDVWIELIHALGQEPLAMLPFAAAIDFEGDQWTFYKPPHEELRELYGVDVQELNVWRPLLEHALDYLPAGKLISTEADAFWLPDTLGTDYHRKHTKSTIILAELDLTARRLGYFHNAGYYSLQGEDFAHLFRLDMPPDPAFLPLFAETVRTDGLVRRENAELQRMSCELWRRHLRRMPKHNPVEVFAERIAAELAAMHSRGLDHYHAWAFANIRQLGSAFELVAANLQWLQAGGMQGVDAAIAASQCIATDSKTLILKGARAVNARRALDCAGLMEKMAGAWLQGVQQLKSVFEAEQDLSGAAH